jgi:hypothetical protein
VNQAIRGWHGQRDAAGLKVIMEGLYAQYDRKRKDLVPLLRIPHGYASGSVDEIP